MFLTVNYLTSYLCWGNNNISVLNLTHITKINYYIMKALYYSYFDLNAGKERKN